MESGKRSRTGSKYKKPGNPTRIVIIKMGAKEVKPGTFKSIIEQSGVSESIFRNPT